MSPSILLRPHGVAVEYTGDNFRFAGSYNDGSRTGQTAFGAADTRFALTARGGYMFKGTWEQFRDQDRPGPSIAR